MYEQPSAGTPTPAVTEAPAAAFEVHGIALVGDAQAVLPGSQVEVAADVENVGTADGSYTAELTVDGVVAARQDVAVPAGETERVALGFVAGPAGTYDVRLGEASLVVAVLGPAAFELGPPVISPNPAEVGDRLSVGVAVTNVGGEAGTYTLELVLDGEVVRTRDVTLGGGERTTAAFDIPPPRAGRHDVSAGTQTAELVVWDIQRPRSGAVIVDKLRGGPGRLEVGNGTQRDALLVLTALGNAKKALFVAYVRSGQTDTFRGIPDGTYLLFYRQGQRWDAKSRRFTAAESRGKFRAAFPFTTTSSTYSVWTVGLEPSLTGNAPTDAVDEGDFPEE